VQLLGVSKIPPSPWWSAEGFPVEPPCDSPDVQPGNNETHALAISVIHPAGSDASHTINIEGVGNWSSNNAKTGGAVVPGLMMYKVGATPGTEAVTVKVSVAAGPWALAASLQPAKASPASAGRWAESAFPSSARPARAARS
jgi:hypothetical protein